MRIEAEIFPENGLLTFVASDFTATVEGEIAATPEPSSFVLLGTGALGLAGVARRRFLAA